MIPTAFPSISGSSILCMHIAYFFVFNTAMPWHYGIVNLNGHFSFPSLTDAMSPLNYGTS